MNRLLLAVIVALGVWWHLPCFVGYPVLSGAQPAWAEEGWKKEFDEVCAKTDDPSDLSAQELRGLIVRCDKLKPVIEGLDESTRKIYLKRLKMCRDLYSYMLSLKERKE